MRTTLLVAFFGLSLVACAGQLDAGGGDDDGGPDCGDGTVNAAEACDDGNNTDGDGCSATCTVELSPRLTSSVDKTTVSTTIGKTEMLTLTLTSVDGYVGDVIVTASVVDSLNAPIPGVTLVGPSAVAVAANATVPSVFTLTVPSNATGVAITGSLKLDLAPTVGPAQNITSALMLANIYTVTYAVTTTDQDTTHPVKSGAQAGNVTVKSGAIIRYKNDSTIVHVTHGGGAFDHEDINAGGQPNATYEQIAGAPGTGSLGCHSHDNDAGYVNFTIE